MHATRLKHQRDGYVRLVLPKGVLVVLKADEYVRALTRGKHERRAARHTHHSIRQQTRADAQRLAWLEEV